MSTTHTGPQPQLLTMREAADLLRVSMTTAYRLAHTGELPTVAVGGQLRVPAAELMARLAAKRVSAP
jgi:excisionase family DNA binding protein